MDRKINDPKSHTFYVSKLLEDRFDSEWHEDGSITIIRRYNLTKYLPIKLLIVGILLCAIGVIPILTGIILKNNILITVGFFIMATGVSFITKCIFTFYANQKTEFERIKEPVRYQCYSWILGVNAGIKKFLEIADRQKFDYEKEYKYIIGLNALSLSEDPFSSSSDIGVLYESFRKILGNEHHKFDFFNAGLHALLLIYDNAPNIKPLLTNKDTEIELKWKHSIDRLVYYNNPIINEKFINDLFSSIKAGNGLEKALSVKTMYWEWNNNHYTTTEG